MASLQRIELLTQRLNGKEPAWIRGYSSRRSQHLSGILRNMEERMSDPDISLDDIEMDIRNLLEEAAETLDDAHEDWLNLQLAARDVCNDVEAMRADADPFGEHWFGGFSEGQQLGGYGDGSTYIEWPNLDISAEALAEVLTGKEYKS